MSDRKLSRNTHALALPANGQLTHAGYSGSHRQKEAPKEKRGLQEKKEEAHEGISLVI
jgi:hypothetical protein